MLSIVDGKPLFVGGCSKDPDARFGYGAGMHGRGYKLHTIWRRRDLPDAWDVTPLPRSEAIVAAELLKQVRVGGYLLADGNDDTNGLHDAASQRGYQLLAQDRRPNAGQGRRQQSVFHLWGIALRHKSFGHEITGVS